MIESPSKSSLIAMTKKSRSWGGITILKRTWRCPSRVNVFQRSTSPLLVDEEVEVVDMADANVCENEMFVTIKWQGRTLDVPLVQVEVVDGDADTRQVVEDWHFWVDEY